MQDKRPSCLCLQRSAAEKESGKASKVLKLSWSYHLQLVEFAWTYILYIQELT